MWPRRRREEGSLGVDQAEMRPKLSFQSAALRLEDTRVRPAAMEAEDPRMQNYGIEDVMFRNFEKWTSDHVRSEKRFQLSRTSRFLGRLHVDKLLFCSQGAGD